MHKSQILRAPIAAPISARKGRQWLVAAVLSATSATLGGCDDSALVLTERGSAVTDYNLSAIDHASHTIAMRVMLQYPDSDQNVILGDDASTGFRIEKAESYSGKSDAPRLRVTYGGQSRLFYDVNTLEDLLNGFAAEQWYDLAVTVNAANELRLYINGGLAVPAGGGTFVLPAGAWTAGHLTFGEGLATPDQPRQCYGMIDDVQIWHRTLSASEISALVAGTLPADAPARAWAFDAPDGLPTMVGNATVRVLPQGSDWPDLLATPQHAPLRLPVDGEWEVIQGVDSGPGNSHRGYAAFALDMVRTDGPTRESAILAAAPGTVIFTRRGSPDAQSNQQVPGCTPCAAGAPVPMGARGDCGYLPNVVVVDHGNDLFTEYVHLIPSSVPPSIQAGTVVQAGDLLGLAGRSGTAGNHLHFGVASTVTLPTDPNPSPSIGLDVPVPGACGYYPAVREFGIVTRAFVFDAYEQNDGGWQPVSETTPAVGAVIRH